MVRPESLRTLSASMALAGQPGYPWRKALRKPTPGFVKMPRRFESCTMRGKPVNDHAQDNARAVERRRRHSTVAGVAGPLSQAASAHDGRADDVPGDGREIFR